MTAKRKRVDGEEDEIQDERTPKAQRIRQGSLPLENKNAANGSTQDVETPTKRRRGRPPGSTQKPKTVPNGIGRHSDPRASKIKPKGKLLFATPKKDREDSGGSPTLLIRNAERSARRKSARTLIQQTIAGDISEENDLDEEDVLARKIWDLDDQVDSDGDLGVDPEDEKANEPFPPTPSKRGPKQYKKTRRKRTPTPPQDLPPHELYFFQNRPGNTKTSNNNLSSLSLLTHEQYYNEITAYKDPHASSLSFLHSLHSRSFPQWAFELSQSFNICLYGYGSKRHLLTSFASHLYSLYPPSDPPKIAMINGYIQTLTIRQVLLTLASLIFPSPLPALPSQPRELATSLLNHLTNIPPIHAVNIFINSLDAPPLQRAPGPSVLAQLASSPYIHLVATCDTPSFPLLWDTPLREQYNFVFHDTTTFKSYGGAEIASVIDDVNALLGRSGRSVKGKEGVGFVLRSLTENARNLYRMLIGELLANMEDDGMANGTEEDDEEEGGQGTSKRKKQDGGGVEYTVLYQKAVEDFICSNEMGFRGLLKEFLDHEMVVSRRDGAGTEILGTPFRREEMEAILEDLMG